MLTLQDIPYVYIYLEYPQYDSLADILIFLQISSLQTFRRTSILSIGSLPCIDFLPARQFTLSHTISSPSEAI